MKIKYNKSTIQSSVNNFKSQIVVNKKQMKK